jgi:hypothetical protein
MLENLTQNIKRNPMMAGVVVLVVIALIYYLYKNGYLASSSSSSSTSTSTDTSKSSLTQSERGLFTKLRTGY